MEQIYRVPADTLRSEFARILRKNGFNEEKASKCAEIFTINSLEGVLSHGVNRFPRFVKNTMEGFVKPDAYPTLIHRFGSIEQWDGNLGPGPLNALFATDRAAELADENGIGMLTLANTNHWMRGGTYGWHAARKGYVLIAWTNTCPNMPAWGARDPRLGNNPFVLAVPYMNDAVVLDFAMTQYSYGKMEAYRNSGEKLPFPGGFNIKDEITNDPAEILESWRPVPIGYWKGAGLSMLLDILAAVLSGGQATHQIKSCSSEYAVSQVFIAINVRSLKNFPSIDSSIKNIIEDLKQSVPADDNSKVRYPGENVAAIREDYSRNGIPVNRDFWEKLLTL